MNLSTVQEVFPLKALAISANPRKGGNSEVRCDEFLKGAVKSGQQVQKIRLAEKKISPCVACYGRMKSHVCVRKDAMGKVLTAFNMPT